MVILACALLAHTWSNPALANPDGGTVTAGSATISSAGNTVHIQQHSDRAVIDWRGFDIAPGERTEFAQPSNSSITLNRVNSAAPSRIDGALTANGNVVIINQNGVVFGRTATVDANSIVATTANTSNGKFMAGGKLEFDEAGDPNAAIINEGTITAKDAGLVGLVAPTVENHGVITARLGRAQLASGDTATVDLYGDGLLEVAVSDHVTRQLVKNTGTIQADGGVVALTAATGKQIVSSAIDAGGTIRAQTVGMKQGAIIIASKTNKRNYNHNSPNVGNVVLTARLDASGKGTAQKGGGVYILGNRIALLSDASIDSSGDAGGGEILVGGDYRGGTYRGLLATPTDAATWGNTPGGYSAVNGTQLASFFNNYNNSLGGSSQVPTASRIFVDQGVILNASALGNGNGGRIITWSDNGTAFAGHADVASYGNGNGGFVEVSGHDWLNFAGTANANAAHGVTGTLLLDPADLTISNLADSAISASTPFGSTGAASSNLSVATLVAALGGANVTITSAPGVGGVGDITFTDPVAWNSTFGLTVLSSNDIIVNASISNTSTGDISLTATTAAAGSITINAPVLTSGTLAMLANRDVTISAALGGNAINLRAANGTTGGIGNLNIGGNLTLGTGNLTLLSGINGTRPTWTATTATLVHAGSFGGAIDIQGFNDLILNRSIALTTNNNLSLTNNNRILINNGLSTLGTGTINIANPFVLQEAASIAITSANQPITFGSTINGTAGGVAESLTVNSGTGTTTFTGALNGIALTSTAGSYVFGSTMGATTPMVSASITGANALTLPDITATGNVTAATTAASTNLVVGGNIVSGGSVTLTAMRDLTVNLARTITSGATGALALNAANGAVGGTGNLNILGNLSSGTGNLTLISGINGTRPNLTLTGVNLVQQGASFGIINMTGFQDLTINRDLTSSGNVTLNAYRDLTISATRTITNGAASTMSLSAANSVVTATGNLNLNGNISAGTGQVTLRSGINGTRPSWTMTNANFAPQSTFGTIDISGFLNTTISRALTSTGNILILAYRDLTVSAASPVTTGAAGLLSLQAAANVVTGTGNLTLGSPISVGTGTLILTSGVNGTRPSWTMDGTSLVRQGATFGAITINGFLDTVIDRDLNSTGTIAITSFRDLTLNVARTVTPAAASALTLQAANAVVAGTGNLVLNGIIAPGAGTLTTRSGINGTRPSFTMTTTNFTPQGATIGAIDMQGFQDLTITRNLTGSAGITLVTQRDLTLSPTYTITSGATGGILMQAANNVVAGTGNLTLGGTLSIGTGVLTLSSGVNGTRPNWTATTTNLIRQGATFGVVSITGFLDTVIDRNINSSGAISITSFRDLTLNAARTITPGAAAALTMRAANGVVTGTGNFYFNGNVAPGTGTTTLYSGINGTRPAYTMTATNFVPQGALGVVDIRGFNDLIIDRDITNSGNVTFLAYRDLTLNAGRTLTSGAAGGISLQAAGGVVGNTGSLNVLGNLSTGTGALTLLSGINGTRPTLTLDGTNLVRQGATFGATILSGFANIIVDRTLNSTGAVAFNSNTLITISDNITSNGTMTFGTATVVAEGVSAILNSTNGNMSFTTTLNGTAGGGAENVTIQSGTGTVTFTGIVGGSATLGNLSVAANALTVSANINGTGNLVLGPLVAGRVVNVNSANPDAFATAFDLSAAEMGRIVNGWGSITLGSLTSGNTTNLRTSFNDPVIFLSGANFINSATLSMADPILVRAVGSITLNNSMTTTNTGANAIVLVAGSNFINATGGGALTTGPGGRWLVYSTDPTGTTGEQLMSNNFNRYTCTYGAACPALGTGNGLLYSYTPLIGVTIAAQAYSYGDTVTPPTGYAFTTTYLNAQDTADGIITGGASLTTDYVQGVDAGTAYSISDGGSTFTSNIGYGFNFITYNGVVGTRAITVRAADQSHIYGFGTLGNTGFTISSSSLYGTDTIATVNLATDASLSSSGQYNYRLTPWTISASGAIFGTGLASNYAVTYADAPVGLTISQRTLTIGATGGTKIYDGLAATTITLNDDRVSGDLFTTAYTAASFPAENVGTGLAVTVTGITASGADIGNYTYAPSAISYANIIGLNTLPAPVGVSIPGTVLYVSQNPTSVTYTLPYTLPYIEKPIAQPVSMRIATNGARFYFVPLSDYSYYDSGEDEDNNPTLAYTTEEGDI
ncbi:MAG: filamentous hemagglutinin N-terminal domain-containing protein [Rickettsiales bacterium]